MDIESVWFKGPVFDAWPPRQHRRILHDSPLRESDETAYAREVVANFLPRAWRRSVNGAEVDRFVDFFAATRPEFPDFEETIRETLPDGFQRSEFLLEHGMVDQIVDRRQLRERLATLFGLLLD